MMLVMKYKKVAKRVLAMLLSLSVILGMADLSMLTVQASTDRDISHAGTNAHWSIARQTLWTYTGNAIEPPVTIKYDDTETGDPQTNGVDVTSYFDYAYSDNIDASDVLPKIVISVNASGEAAGYSGTIARQFFIDPKPLTDPSISVVIDPQFYTGSNFTTLPGTAIRVTDTARGGVQLVNGDDYTYTILPLEPNATDATTGTIRFSGQGNYKGSIDKQFDIVKNTFDDITIKDATDASKVYTSGTIPRYNYTGSPIGPELEITDNSSLNPAHVLLSTQTGGLGAEYRLQYGAATPTVNTNTAAGKGLIQIIGQLSYTGSVYHTEFWIVKPLTFPSGEYPNSTNDIKVTLAGTQPYPYTGSEIKPTVTVLDTKPSSKKLEQGVDYTVSYFDNVEAGGTGQVEITGMGAYSGTIEVPFRIAGVNTGDPRLRIEVAPCVYNGEEQKPEIKVFYDNVELPDTVYGGPTKIEYSNNINAGTATLKITGNGSTMIGTKVQSFTIEKKSLADTNGSGAIEAILSTYPGGPEYTGTVKEPKVKVTYEGITDAGGMSKPDRILMETLDYTLSYRNNVNAGTDTAVIVISGTGNYKDSKEFRFTILPVSIDNMDTTVAAIDPIKYTTQPITPIPLITRIEGNPLSPVTLTPNKGNVILTYGSDTTNRGTVRIGIQGIGNYTGYREVTFEIIRKPLEDTDIVLGTIPAQEYIANPLRQILAGNYTVRYNIGSNLYHSLSNGSDYTLEWTNDTDVGVGKVTVVADPDSNYSGSKSVEFAITPRDVGTGNNLFFQKGSDPKKTTIDPVVYLGPVAGDTVEFGKMKSDGTPLYPILAINYVNAAAGTGMNEPLVEGESKDYTISYTENTKVGKASITITGRNNYKGTKTVLFNIQGDIANNNRIPDDVTVLYDKNDVFWDGAWSEVYTGNQIKPEPIVKCWGVTLRPGIDYSLVYGTNVRVGDTADDTSTDSAHETGGYISVVGKGDYYINDQEASFRIIKKNLSEPPTAVIAPIPDQEYTGVGIKPRPNVSFNGHLLSSTDPIQQTDDFEYRYGNNVQVGEANIYIDGQGESFYNSTSSTFKIVPRDIGKGSGAILVPAGMIEDDMQNVLKADPFGKAVPIKQDDLQVTYTKAGGPTIPMVKGVDYDIEYIDNDKVGTATIKIIGKGNFRGENAEDVKFVIKGDLLDYDHTFVVKLAPISFTGSNIEPHLEITTKFGDRIVALIEGIDYDLSYAHNFHAATDDPTDNDLTDEEGLAYDPTYVPTIFITGKNNYDLSQALPISPLPREETFTIRKKNLSDPEELADGIDFWNGNPSSIEYNGTQIKPVLSITNHGNALTTPVALNQDYELILDATDSRDVANGGALDGYINNIDVPSGWHDTNSNDSVLVVDRPGIKIRGTGQNYRGETTVPFEVYPRSVVDKISAVTKITVDKTTGAVVTSDYPVGTIELDYNGVPITFDSGYAGFPVSMDTDGNPISLADIIVHCIADGATPPNVLNIELVNEKDKDEPGNDGKYDYTITYDNNDGIGLATVNIIGHGNYQGTMPINFRITGSIVDSDPSSDLKDHVEIIPIPDQPFQEGPVHPNVDVYVWGTLLDPAMDYDLTYPTPITDPKNIVVGSKDDPDASKRPTLTITGKGFYRGIQIEYFNIVPMDLSEYDIGRTLNPLDPQSILQVVGLVSAGYMYNGSAINPGVSPTGAISLKVKNSVGTVTVNSANYKITYGENNINVGDKDATNPPMIIITAQGTGATPPGSGNYVGSMRVPFTIIPKTGLLIQNIAAQQYTGSEIKPEVVVTVGNGAAATTLTKGTDYEIVEYTNNIDVASVASPATAPTVKIRGLGNYGGEYTKTFAITKKDINLGADDFIVTTTGSFTYTGQEFMPEVAIKWKSSGKVLALGTDYTVTKGTGNVVNAPTGTVTITGTGTNYTGVLHQDFTIKPKPITDPQIRVVDLIPDEAFSGVGIEPIPQVFYDSPITGSPVQLLASRDYTLSYSNNINAGEATITIKGTGNYAASRTVKFKITPKAILDSDVTISEIPKQAYTGKEIKAVPEIICNGYTATVDKDYTITYGDNTKPGTVTYTITGKGSFSGVKQGEFLIQGDLEKAEIDVIPMKPPTGTTSVRLAEEDVQLTFVDKNGRKVRVVPQDYTIEYDPLVDYTKIGEVPATIKANRVAGDEDTAVYIGQKEITFIISENLADAWNIQGIAQSYAYTGAAVTPLPYIVFAGKQLKVGVDYRLEYANNINAGTPNNPAKVIITGLGKYAGQNSRIEKTFNIVPKSIARATTPVLKNQVYNNKVYTPAVSVVDGTKALTKDKDYSAVYTNNKTPGTSTVIVNGKGNYIGNKTLHFDITLAQAEKLTATPKSTKAVTLKWTKQTAVTGYEVYNATTNKLVTKIKKNANSVAISGLSPKQTYKYKVRSYVTTGSSIRYGSFSSIVQTSPKLNTPTKVTVKSAKAKQATISWSKVDKASKYEVYQSTSKNGTYSRVATTSKTSYTKTKLTTNKTYYYKVRAYKTVNKQKIYSDYSSKKSVKVK
ncbi:fibronectin type III domain-containing protein [Lachnospiraceae bacterium ZAX-1]